MSDALGLIGFYFTLIGFVSGLFFTRLDGWYGSVRQFHGKLVKIEERNDFVSANSEANGLKASTPSGSFIGVGLLLTALVGLGLFVPLSNSPISPAVFLYAPMIVTVAAYWVGGGILLQKASGLIHDAQETISKGLSGG